MENFDDMKVEQAARALDGVNVAFRAAGSDGRSHTTAVGETTSEDQIMDYREREIYSEAENGGQPAAISSLDRIGGEETGYEEDSEYGESTGFFERVVEKVEADRELGRRASEDYFT